MLPGRAPILAIGLVPSRPAHSGFGPGCYPQIGRLDEILRETAIKSLSRGFKKVEKTVLQEVAREYA